MIKTLLFITTIAFSFSVSAQSLILENSSSQSIAGKTSYHYGTGLTLSETKFHVTNTTNSGIDFGCTVYETANSVPDDWQVCFGQDCRTAYKNTAAAQKFYYANVPAMDSYDTVKVAPFSFAWATGDWGVWRITVMDTLNPADSSSAFVYWEAGGKPAGDQNSSGMIDGSEIAGDVDENGTINGGEITGDMNGDGIINVWEVSGDANGNGVIDNGEILSTAELNKHNMNISSYPNPATNNLTISYNIDGAIKNGKVELYDVLGQKVNTYKLTENKGQLNIAVSELNAGVYFYTFIVAGKTLKTERVIVK